MDGTESYKTSGSTGQKYSSSKIEAFIASGSDPAEFRRDSHVHFAYEHEEKGRQVLKVPILEKVPDNANPRPIEDKFKRLTGSYEYKDLGRGRLNSS